MGSVVTMECKVAGSLPLSVEWSKGKQKITNSSKYKLMHVENSLSLELQLTEGADTGEYSCKVTNDAGSCVCSGVLTAKGSHPEVDFITFLTHRLLVMYHNHFSVWVLVPPRFIAEPESQAVIPKSSVLFRSVFEGTPPFTVKWFKDDIELITEPSCMIRLQKYSSSLEMNSVGTLQSGIYSCQVSNDAGTVNSAAELLVKGWTILFFVHTTIAIQLTPSFFFHFHSSSFFIFLNTLPFLFTPGISMSSSVTASSHQSASSIRSSDAQVLLHADDCNLNFF